MPISTRGCVDKSRLRTSAACKNNANLNIWAHDVFKVVVTKSFLRTVGVRKCNIDLVLNRNGQAQISTRLKRRYLI